MLIAKNRCLAAAISAMLLVASCSQSGEDLAADPEPFGDFKLATVHVRADDSQTLPLARDAAAEELEAALEAELERRLGRYSGETRYSIEVEVAGHFIAPAGVPIVFSPRSTMALHVKVRERATRRAMNEDPRLFLVGEPFSGKTLVGSGLVQSKEEQIQALAERSAYLIERWLKSEDGPVLGGEDSES